MEDSMNSISRLVRVVATLVLLPRLHPQQEDNAMKGHWVTLVASLVVAAMILGISGVSLADSEDQDECTVATLDGLYVFTASGFNIVGGVPQPKAIVELLHFLGDGTLKGTVPGGIVSINGVINPINIPPNPPGTGSYTLQSLAAPDKGCVGTLTFANGPAFFIFTAQNGKEIQMIQTNPNTVFQGTATKVK
jgi:hypothetical protein